jgi:hypothetical protein
MIFRCDFEILILCCQMSGGGSKCTKLHGAKSPEDSHLHTPRRENLKSYSGQGSL